MLSRSARACGLVAAAVLPVPTWAWQPPRSGGDAEAAVDKKDITITLKISDKASGLTLEARKAVAKDTSAFGAVKRVVAMAYRTDPETGPAVASLCGVAPARGSALSCSIDGQVYRNLGSVGLKADVTIDWKTVPVM